MSASALTPSVCVLDVVGLGLDHVDERMPRLSAWAASQRPSPLAPVFPAVTSTVQASFLTGCEPSGHGIVANGWLFGDTMEVRFWQQSHRLLQKPSLPAVAQSRARAQGRELRSAQLFWWFNQGSPAHWSLTPKPFYGSDGDKAFAIYGTPQGFAREMEYHLGRFPFPAFWGPLAGYPASEWIARAAARTLEQHRPDLTLVYLPHLDYDLQRFGPTAEVLDRNLAQIDTCIGRVLDACERVGVQPLVLSEYTIEAVGRVEYPNRVLREAGWLVARSGPFGETLDTFASRAFAVCDHQVAHVYVADPDDRPAVRARLEALEGVESVLDEERLRAYGLDHERSGDLVLVARSGSWFAYPYWLDDARAPDFASTVDIHRKPGFDPCELFFDPSLPVPKLRAALRLAQKKLGLRYRMDVVGIDATIVRGSHGRIAADPQRGPVCIGPPAAVPESGMRATDVRDCVLRMLELPEER